MQESPWQTLLELPYEVQVALFAGYAAYKVATVGRAVAHRTEDFLLQVLLFGTVGRLAVIGSTLAGVPLPASESARLFAIAVGTLGASIVAAALWRKMGQRCWWHFMSWCRVYHDDHESTALASIQSEPARWRMVQLHCGDGQIYESDFDAVPENLPLGRVLLNADGVTMYVTRIYRADDTESDLAVADEGFGYRVNFFPKETIKRLEIGWRW